MARAVTIASAVVIAFAVATAATACGSAAEAPARGDAGTSVPGCPADAVALETNGAPVADCGSVVPGTGCLGNQPPPSTADLAAIACLEQALGACAPARLDFAQPAAQTGPLQTFLVEPGDAGACRLVVLTDDRATTNRTVSREACKSVTVDTHCLGVWGAGCGAPATLCKGD